jgi:hypothetical protein
MSGKDQSRRKENVVMMLFITEYDWSLTLKINLSKEVIPFH